MTINYKHKFFIYHPDGKFTVEQIKEMLDAAYKAGREEGYQEGYQAGKSSNWTITYPYNNPRYYDVTCNPTITTASSSLTCNDTNTISVGKDPLKEFKYNGTEK